MNSLKAPQGDFTLNRFPLKKEKSGKKENLRAWDAADEYLLHHLSENKLLTENTSLLIVNDNFGGLAIALNQYHPVVMTDSYLATQAISLNLENNNISDASVNIINSLQSPEK
ncbi:23S rRNA (guanine(1835)-N(2))-methyltransferase, partial [hydrothermal vent metagenome]